MKIRLNIFRGMIFKYKDLNFLMETEPLINSVFSNGLRISLGIEEYKKVYLKAYLFKIFKLDKLFITKLIITLPTLLILRKLRKESEIFYKLLNQIIKFKYKKITIGDNVYSSFLRNHPEGIFLKNILSLFFLFIRGGLIYETINEEFKKDIKNKKFILYLSHSIYLNGIIEKYFSDQKNLIIRSLFFPHIFSIYKNNSQKIIHDSFKANKIVAPLKYIEIKSDQDCLSFIDQRINDPSKLTYIKNWDDIDEDLSNTFSKSKYNIILCLHSFTDNQLWYGKEDELVSTYDWSIFTIDYLIHLKRFYKYDFDFFLKPHPTWSDNYEANSINIIDKEIYLKVLKKYQNIDLKKLNPFIKIKDINKIINKEKTLFISHHGTIIPEAAFLGFKSLSSINSPWSDKYEFSTIYKNKNDYKNLIKDFIKGNLIIPPNYINSLSDFIKEYYFQHGFLNEKHFNNFVKKLKNNYGDKIYLNSNSNYFSEEELKKFNLSSAKFISENFNPKDFFDDNIFNFLDKI